MEIKQEVERIVKAETDKRLAPLRVMIKKEIDRFVTSKAFVKDLRKYISEYVYNILEDDGIERFIPDKKIDLILQKAAKSCLK